MGQAIQESYSLSLSVHLLFGQDLPHSHDYPILLITGLN